MAVFDLAIEHQNGRGNVRNTQLNILKGFFAYSLISIVPVELYKFCISLQNTFANGLAQLVAGQRAVDIANQSKYVLGTVFSAGAGRLIYLRSSHSPIA